MTAGSTILTKMIKIISDSSYDLIIYATRPDIHLENFYEYYNFSNKHLIEKPISSNFNFLKELVLKNIKTKRFLNLLCTFIIQ